MTMLRESKLFANLKNAFSLLNACYFWAVVESEGIVINDAKVALELSSFLG